MSPDDIPRSIGRVLDLLEIVLAEGGCNLTTAAVAAGLSPTTALRHLRALEARGYLHRDDAGIFSAGPTVRHLTTTVHSGDPRKRLIESAQPHLNTLAGATGESTYLAVGANGVVTYVAAAESSRAIRHVGWVGQNLPLTGTAVGEALTAPGTVAVRTGAVEPDITAVSLALPAYERFGVAVSVVGPAHRLDKAAQRHIKAELERTVTSLCTDLGIDLLGKDAS